LTRTTISLEPLMIQISYLSRVPSPLSAEELLKLLQQCRDNNTAQGITGMLFYGNGTFLQVLEGDAAAVDALVDKIARDPRHNDVRILSRRTVGHREYADWTMGFERVTDAGLRDIEGLQDFSAADFTPAGLAAREDVVETLMERFRAPHWDPLVRELDAKDKVIEQLKRELVRQRGRTSLATLIVESMTESARKGEVGTNYVRLCESALKTLRGGPSP
jgi:hypothetical protein